MTVLLTIGDFSRMTHLSVKALRHYHDVGLLEPAEVDRSSGYRLYDAGQVPIAQVIRRFRDLGMPVDEVKSVLDAPDVTTRNQVIVAHLERMEDQLAQTQATVASLRAVLEGPRRRRPVEYRTAWARPPPWRSARRSPRPIWSRGGPTPSSPCARPSKNRDVSRAGPDGCLYPNEMFELEEGEMVAFVPVTGHPVGVGPGAGLRAARPSSSPSWSTRAPTTSSTGPTGRSGTYVAERAIGVEGPIRELYVVSPLDAEDPAALRTELGWPVFRAG